MGRELKRVPANWEHPTTQVMNHRSGVMEERYKPLYDRTAQEAFDEWLAEYQEWLDGEHDKTIAKYGQDNYPKSEPYRAFCEWHGCPPDPEYYRPEWKDEDRTWWQVWETVSEGTPVTPPFATKEELIEYLISNGDFWGEPWTRKQAETFVNGLGWAPSLVVVDGAVMSGVQAMAELNPIPTD